MTALLLKRLAASEAALRPTRRCWIAAIEAGETTAEALHRHARDPELVGHAFVLLPMKLDELRRIDHAVT
jgi:hypothetical protein